MRAQVMARRRYLASLNTKRPKKVADLVLPSVPDRDPVTLTSIKTMRSNPSGAITLKQYLKDKGVGTLIQWGSQAVRQLKAHGFTQHMPYTDWLFKRVLMLPMNMSLFNDDVRYLCDNIRAFYGYPVS